MQPFRTTPGPDAPPRASATVEPEPIPDPARDRSDPAPDPARDREEADRRTAGLAAIVVLLLLLIGGLTLARALYAKGKLEDCLMAGRAGLRPPRRARTALTRRAAGDGAVRSAARRAPVAFGGQDAKDRRRRGLGRSGPRRARQPNREREIQE